MKLAWQIFVRNILVWNKSKGRMMILAEEGENFDQLNLHEMSGILAALFN